MHVKGLIFCCILLAGMHYVLSQIHVGVAIDLSTTTTTPQPEESGEVGEWSEKSRPTCSSRVTDLNLAVLDNPLSCESGEIRICVADGYSNNAFVVNLTNSPKKLNLTHPCTCVHCCDNNASCDTYASRFCQKPGSHGAGICSERNGTCGCEYTEYTTTTNTTTNTTTTFLTPSSPKPICGGHEVNETLAFEQNEIPCDSASLHSCLDMNNAYHIRKNGTNSCACAKCCSNLDDCTEYRDRFCNQQSGLEGTERRKCFAGSKTCGCIFTRFISPPIEYLPFW